MNHFPRQYIHVPASCILKLPSAITRLLGFAFFYCLRGSYGAAKIHTSHIDTTASLTWKSTCLNKATLCIKNGHKAELCTSSQEENAALVVWSRQHSSLTEWHPARPDTDQIINSIRVVCIRDSMRVQMSKDPLLLPLPSWRPRYYRCKAQMAEILLSRFCVHKVTARLNKQLANNVSKYLACHTQPCPRTVLKLSMAITTSLSRRFRYFWHWQFRYQNQLPRLVVYPFIIKAVRTDESRSFRR